MTRASRLRTWTRPARHALAYGGLRVFVGALACLPLGLALAAGALSGRVIGRLAFRTRRTAARGLSTVDPRPGLVSEHFASLGRRFVEVALLERMLAAGRIQVPPEAVDALRAPLQVGRGALVLTAHFGNWELLGAAVARAGLEIHSVAAQMGGGPLHRWLARARAAAGLTLHPPGGGARSAVERLQGGGLLAIFFDLATRERARDLPFFGRPTAFSRTSERLHAATGAVPLLVLPVREGNGYRVTAEPLTSDDPLAEAVARLEAAVHAAPAEWVWLVDRWPGRGKVPP